LNFPSINQIEQNERINKNSGRPSWLLRQPSGLKKQPPSDEYAQELLQLQEFNKQVVTHSLFNLRAKRKIEKETASTRSKQGQENKLSVF